MTIFKTITDKKTEYEEHKLEKSLDLENLKQLQSSGELELNKTPYSSLSELADSLYECRRSNKLSHRICLAMYGRDEDYDRLVHDPDWFVREIVATKGRDKDLDVLVDDEDVFVRQTVASHGRKKDLIELVGDESVLVRQEVVRQLRNQNGTKPKA